MGARWARRAAVVCLGVIVWVLLVGWLLAHDPGQWAPMPTP